jgi:spore coat polysaccharide biosynthesis protein SpsF (cytidylyltransferase family)
LWCIFSCNDRAPSLGIARLPGKVLLTILKVLMQAICLHNPCKI